MDIKRIKLTYMIMKKMQILHPNVTLKVPKYILMVIVHPTKQELMVLFCYMRLSPVSHRLL